MKTLNSMRDTSASPVNFVPTPFLRAHAQLLALSGGLLGLCVGAAVLVGWFSDIESLKRIYATFPTMKVNTAICFLLTGLALTCSSLRQPGKPARWYETTALIIPIILAALTLIEYVFHLNFGIDEFFIKDVGQQTFPGRMAINTALNFILISAAVLWLDKRFLKKFYLSEICAITAILFICPSLVGYLYNVQPHFTIYSYTQIALHTSITFALMSRSALLLRPERGLIGELTSDSIGALSLRGTLPKLVFFLTTFGWLRLQGERLGLYEGSFGLSVMVITTILVSTVVLWNNSRLLNKNDQLRRNAEEKSQSAAFAIRVLEDQKRTDSIIRDLMDRLDLALGAAEMGAWSLDLATQKAWRSVNHDEIFGYAKPCSEWSHDFFLGHILEEDRKKIEKDFRAALGIESFTSQCRIQRADNQAIAWIEIQGRTFFNSNQKPTHMMGIVIDITKRKATEERLLHSAKMSSLGEMAGGVAHEINTPLSIIAMITSKLHGEVKTGNFDRSRTLKSLETAEKTVFRIAAIINGLRYFSRDGSKDPFKSISVNNLLDETLSFCRERFKNHGVDLQLPNGIDNLQLECRPVEISQVLLNLLNNAYDAACGAQNKWVAIEVRDSGAMIELSVSDSGSGIQPQIRDKIMQPFFTTKGVGKGTGLGLSISIGIIESHKGTLVLDPTAEHTRFIVKLPKAHPQSR